MATRCCSQSRVVTKKEPFWFRMAALTLKNVPDKLLAKLRKAAAENRRSLNQQALHILAAATEARAPTASTQDDGTQRSQLDEWRELCGAWRSDEPASDDVGRVYAARSRGRKVEL